MVDSIQVIGGGVEAVRTVLPTSFNWLLFFVALILMSAPSLDMVRQLIQNQNFGVTTYPKRMEETHSNPQSTFF